ncbi:MAG: TonB-dependent receptor, partial [Acidobacteriota bacterium]
VKEFQVVSNSFAAEFGRAQGGIVNIVTRAGSNERHGSIFFLNRSDEISARPAFLATEPPYSQYQFGATLAGPLQHDRKFYFLSFERLSIAQSASVSIPTPILTSLNRMGFPARAGAIPFSETASTLLARTDFKIGDANLLKIRYNYAGIYNGALEPFGSLRAESAGGLQRLRDDNIAIANTYLNVPHQLVNETRFLFARRDINVDPLDPVGPRLNIVSQLGTAVAGRSAFLPNPREERIFQIVNNVSLTRGRHQVKFGVDFLHIYLPDGSTQLPIGAAGQAFFQPIDFAALSGVPTAPFFTALEAFDPSLRTPAQQSFLRLLAAGLPSRFPGFPQLDLTRLSLPLAFAQAFGDPFITVRYNYISTFIQDDVRLRPNLIVKLGLRYDQERVQFLPKNSGNFSPRLAIAYNPGQRENLRLFAAYGIFHGITPFQPIFNSVLAERNGFKVMVLPFPFSIIPFSLPGRHFPESRTLPQGVQFIPQLSAESEVQSDYRNGYTQQVNAGFEYLLGKNTLLSASYQYVRGIKLLLSRNINPVVRPIPGDSLNSQIKGRVDPTRGGVQEIESAGDSYYNAFTLAARQRIGDRFLLQAHYTFSKTLDNFVDYRVELVAYQDPLNLGNERGHSVQDVRNRFVASSIWSLDYSQHPLLRDYQLSTIVTLESGRPYNLLTGVDLDMNGDVPAGDRPLGIARNAGITPGFASLDLRLTRRITFKEKYNFEGFLEIFNVTNRVNVLVDFNGNVFPPGQNGRFDLPTQRDGRFILPKNRQNNSFAPRQLQFGLRFAF